MFRERFKAICCFPFTISLFMFFVAVYLYMPSLSVFEADMSINVLKYVSVKAYTLLLLLLSFFVLLMSDSGYTLFWFLLLSICAYRADLLVYSAFDDHAVYGAYISYEVAKYGYTWKVDNVFMNWPAPFIFTAIFYTITHLPIAISAIAVKSVHLLLFVLIIWSILNMYKGTERCKLTKSTLILILPLIYVFNVYQLTSAQFLPIFSTFLYLLLIKHRPNLYTDLFSLLLLLSVLPLSHGFSTFSLTSLSIYLVLFFNYRIAGIKGSWHILLALLAIAYCLAYITFYLKPWLWKTVLNTNLIPILNIFRREDIVILNPATSKSPYAYTYRIALLTYILTVLGIACTTVIAQHNNKFLRYRIFLPLLFISLPATLIQYSTETFPRLAALCSPLILVLLIHSIKLLYSKSNVVTKIAISMLVLSAPIVQSIAVVGQPFRYTSNDGVGSFLARYAQGYDAHEPYIVYPYFEKSVKIEDGSLVTFNVKRFTNLLFYSKDKASNELKLIGEAILSYNLIYNGLHSLKWNFPTLIFIKDGRG